MVRSILILFNRQNIFTGDLNIIQQLALSWLINHDIEEQIELEKLRAVNTGLATNPATAKDYIMSLLKEEQQQTTDEEWTTPQSVEEIEAFLRTNALN